MFRHSLFIRFVCSVVFYIAIYCHPVLALEQEWIRGLRLGTGVDVVRQEVKGDCVEWDAVQEGVIPGVEGGQFVDYDLNLIESMEDLATKLNVSGSASYSALWGSVESKAEYLKDVRISSYYVNAYLSNYVENPEIFLLGVRLTDNALQMLTANPMQFFDSCGQYFMASVVPGGEFIATIIASTNNENDKKAFKAELNANVFAKVHLEISDEFKRDYAGRQEAISATQSGGVGTVAASTLSELQQRWANFSDTVSNNPVAMFGVARTYNTVSNWPTVTQGQDTSDILRGLTILNNLRWTYRSILNDANHVRSSPYQFQNVNMPQINQMRQELSQLINAVDNQARTCLTDASKCAVDPTWKQPEQFILPLRYAGYCPDLYQVTPTAYEGAFPLPHCGGDAEMDGHRPVTNIRVDLSYDTLGNSKLQGSISMKESKSDWTHFCDSINIPLTSAMEKDGCTVVKIESPTSGTLNKQAGEDDHKWHLYGGQGLIKSAYCRSDRKGKETNAIGCKQINFNPINVKYGHIEDTYGNQQLRSLATATQYLKLQKTAAVDQDASTSAGRAALRERIIAQREEDWRALPSSQQTQKTVTPQTRDFLLLSGVLKSEAIPPARPSLDISPGDMWRVVPSPLQPVKPVIRMP
jgi:hypothetical protein